MKTKMLIVAIMFIFNSMSAKSVAFTNKSNSEIGQGTIHGQVIDHNSKSPMEYVSVVLYSATDSAVISGTITDPEGKFSLVKISEGNYYLEFNFIGFEKKRLNGINISKLTNKIELGDITLEPVETKLKEVTITGEKAKIEYQLDKRIVNVDKNLNAQGGTAVDALENTPSVQVDAQGNLTLRGSSDYVVLIDGKPSVIKGSDALKQIPANAIKQIEVITNPSAKYEVDGNAGIINIISKKDKLQGLNGNMNLSGNFIQRKNANLLFNYRKAKFNYFVGIDYADNKYFNYIDINNITINSDSRIYIDEQVEQTNKNENLNFKGGFDFDPNAANSFSVSFSLGRQGYDNGSDAKIHRWDNNLLNAYSASSNFMDVTGDVINLTFDYTHHFTENHKLSFSSTYGSWNGMDNNLLRDLITDNRFNETGLNSQLNFIKDNFNYQFRGNVDYSRPLASGKFEGGLQYRYEYRMEDFDFKDYNPASEAWVYNADYSYYLDYSNDILSGYAIYSGKWSGIDYQVGIRSEFFTRSIVVDTENQPYNFDKFMVYPSIHLSKQVKEKHQFQLSYGRRINRPQPWLLNNTPSFIDPYNIFMGDPGLKFEYIDAFEFNYRVSFKKFSLSTQTYLRNTTNAFTAFRLMDEEGIMVHRLANAENQLSFGLEQGVDVDLTKWWKLSGNVNIYNYTLRAMISDQEKTQQVNSWDARLVSNFNLKKGTRFQFTLYHRSKGLDAMGETSGFSALNLAVNQAFLKGKLRAGVSVQNLFGLIDFDYTTKTDRFDNRYHLTTEKNLVLFNLSYNFNNFQQKNRGRSDDINFKGGGGF
jgi:outer membrane receptor protein involved in Fe transport